MNPGTGLIDDLASLNELDERILLAELRIRYSRGVIYTYVGDILIAVNPYKALPIYTPQISEKYCDIKVRSQHPPHIYAIADKAFQQMIRSGNDQCCVVSGESGAGKTESTKLMVKHIIQLCKNCGSNLHERIVEVNPLLEAFGNARTTVNNNSSRFGKFIELFFTRDGRVVGAQIDDYLLEKSRVVSQGVGEKNFHIFYYMFAGLDREELKNYLLDKPEKHRILSPVDGSALYWSDAHYKYCVDMLEHLKLIMQLVGFQSEDIDMVFALLAAVLHLGDIQFAQDPDTDGVYIVDEVILDIVAQLLGVNPEELASVLISKVSWLRGEKIVSLKNLEQASDGRDALAKALYARLFGWIVRQINVLLKPGPDYKSSPGPKIGILDIAGFENFESNSFEQLCINVANEQLQYYFNQHIFAWELEEYDKEGLKEINIEFTNNWPLLELFLEKPVGIFSLLDEETKFPRATDSSFVDKIVQHHTKNPHLVRSLSNRVPAFGVIHYAGQVIYNAEGFLEKNRDTLSPNILECMKNSDSQIICDLFTAQVADTGTLLINSKTPIRSRKSILRCRAPDVSRRTKSLSRQAGKALKERYQARRTVEQESLNQKTAGAKFQTSLTDLMSKLLEAEPQFVRCIKPNNYKQADNFEPRMVLEQLRYTGVLETTRIRHIGFPTRLPFHTFLDRYKMIAFPLTAKVDPIPLHCYQVLQAANIHGWEIGMHKVFLKYWHTEQLNLHMDIIQAKVLRVQSYVRGFLTRKKFRAKKEKLVKERSLLSAFVAILTQQAERTYHLVQLQQEHDKIRQERKVEEERKAREKKKEEERKLTAALAAAALEAEQEQKRREEQQKLKEKQQLEEKLKEQQQQQQKQLQQKNMYSAADPYYSHQRNFSPANYDAFPPADYENEDDVIPRGHQHNYHHRDIHRNEPDYYQNGHPVSNHRNISAPPQRDPHRDHRHQNGHNADFERPQQANLVVNEHGYLVERSVSPQREPQGYISHHQSAAPVHPMSNGRNAHEARYNNMPDVVQPMSRRSRLGSEEDLDQTFGQAPQPRRGLRRTPAGKLVDKRNMYPSVKSSVKAPSEFAVSDAGHYRRPLSRKVDKDVLYQQIVEDSLQKRSSLEPDIWCKLVYMEREQGIAKFYVREPQFTVDGSDHEYDGQKLGLAVFENPFRDDKTAKVREHIGKGVLIKRDKEGNIWAIRLGKNDVIVKGYNDPSSCSVSADVIRNMGRLPAEKTIKVFDMGEFKSLIALELRNRHPNLERLRTNCIVALSFVRNTLDDMDTPCWIIIINYVALNALDDEHVLHSIESSLSELMQDQQGKEGGKVVNRQWSKNNLRHDLQQAEREPPGRKNRIELRKQKKPITDFSWLQEPVASPALQLLELRNQGDKNDESELYSDDEDYEEISDSENSPSSPTRSRWAKIEVLKKEKAKEESKPSAGQSEQPMRKKNKSGAA
ncbi:myosin-IIIb isoform X2 [Lingula anatina]|uniref:Myosin-IIIb isoform X2 n=1 Tax=Lingula anatina TaxID=7574 RepID=A0A1S3K648_LINAN|nr:myosin-IIIb isoform X2 [Lingula anatina]|eukprot:XP_013418100.1 myosin-IIIb isoform X2 [Lingula anatina]